MSDNRLIREIKLHGLVKKEKKISNFQDLDNFSTINHKLSETMLRKRITAQLSIITLCKSSKNGNICF